jgi:hypothetical protein
MPKELDQMRQPLHSGLSIHRRPDGCLKTAPLKSERGDRVIVLGAPEVVTIAKRGVRTLKALKPPAVEVKSLKIQPRQGNVHNSAFTYEFREDIRPDPTLPIRPPVVYN